MTAPRAFRRHNRRAPLSAAQRSWLLTDDDGGEKPTMAEFLARKDPERVWREHRDDLLPGFIAAHPGRRPFSWWKFDAPEPARRRLSGVGSPASEHLAHAPTFAFGIPTHWVSEWDAKFYRGLARDIQGRPIGAEFREGHFTGVAIDPANPPTFESEAAYLKRHGLLTRDERARLTAADYAPEVIAPMEDAANA